MKREIKFRGLAKDSSWYYGDLICDDMGARICYVDYIPPSLQDPCGDTQFIKVIIDYATVGQYTGLKDKNGKEIYEGDLLAIAADSFDITTAGHEVVFGTQIIDIDEGGIENKVTGFLVKFNDNSGYCNIPDECLVIGNIYQNPELL